MDKTIFRGIAKIAFNYLAYWAGPEFIIQKPFHPIRKFIRFGEKASYPFVEIIEKAILGDEPEEGKRRLGHIITLEWSKNKLSIISLVSLFNMMTYSVLLSKDYRGKDFVYTKGNLFRLGDKKIDDLILPRR